MVGGEGTGAEALTGPQVFLSYRREDSSGYAVSLNERLVERFGQANVFMDIASLAPGVAFLDAIEQTLSRCDIVLVMIGRGWLSAADREGRRRLEIPNDFVRLEVEAALSGNHRVIPVLVAGADMPLENEVPESISKLTGRHAVDLSDRRWRSDTEDLLDAIERGWLPRPEATLETEPGKESKKAAAIAPWDPEGFAAEALASVVAAYGREALADEKTLANRLSDRLPEDMLAREQSLLLAASRRGVAMELEEHMSQGIGVDAAVRLTTERLNEREALDPSGCAWATDAFALALRLNDPVIADKPPLTVPHVAPLRVTEKAAGPAGHLAPEKAEHAGVEEPFATDSPKVAMEPDPPPFEKADLAGTVIDPVLTPVAPEDDVVGITVVDSTENAQSPPELFGIIGATPPTPPPSKRSRRRLLLTGGVVAVLAAAGVSAAVISSNSTTSPSAEALTWSRPKAIDSHVLRAVSCPLATFCVAVDNVGNALVGSLGSWFEPIRIDAGNNPSDVSCASATFCMVVDEQGNAISYSNGKWSRPTNIDKNFVLDAVSCPSVTFCMALGSNENFVNEGNALSYSNGTWSQPKHIDGSAGVIGFFAVSCPSATFCMAVDSSGNALSYTNGTWHRSVLGNILDGVSCPSATFCMAVEYNGNAALSYTNGRWSEPNDIDPNQNHSVSAVSCPSATFCMAVDSSGNALSYSNGTWSRPTNIDGSTFVTAVSCASATFCAAVDNSGNVCPRDLAS